MDWDGNELLLSDVLGSEQDAVNVGIEQEVERSLLLAAEATIICLVLAYPVGYFLSRCAPITAYYADAGHATHVDELCCAPMRG